MTFSKSWMTGVFVVCGALVAMPAPAMPPASDLLPANTYGFFRIPNYSQFLAGWEKTNGGALMNDPAMKAFRDAASARLESGESMFVPALGLTPEEFKELARTEATFALVPTSTGVPAAVMLIEAAQASKPDEVLARTARRLTTLGATLTVYQVGADRVNVYQLPAALRRGALQQVCYLRKGDCLIVASQLESLQWVLVRLANSKDALSNLDSFQATTVAAQQQFRDAHFSWFVNPLPFAEAILTFIGEPVTVKPNPFQVLNKDGFTAFRGVGGIGILGSAEHQFLARTYVHVPRPYQGAMRMLDVFNSAPVSPPAWIPQNVASLFAINVNYRQAFDAYASLYDGLYGEGEKGVFEDLVRSFRDDPAGPRVDLRKEFVGEMRAPAWIATLRPGQDKTLQGVTAIPLAQEKAVGGALRRLFEGDDEVKPFTFGEYGAWQLLPPKRKARQGATTASRPTLAVTQQAFLIADTPDLLASVRKQESPLSEAAAYRNLMKRLEPEANSSFFQGYFNHEEVLRDLWIRLESGQHLKDNTLASSMQKLFVSRDPSFPFDTKKLPRFAEVSRHARSHSGVVGSVQQTGWKLLWLTPR